MKNLNLILCLLFVHSCIAQPQSFFNNLPHINEQILHSQFYSIALDSNSIFILGEVDHIDSTTGNQKSNVFAGKFDYNGNLLESKILEDSNVIQYAININALLYKLNDSIYFHIIYVKYKDKPDYYYTHLFKWNIKQFTLVQDIELSPPRKDLLYFNSISQTEINDTHFPLVFYGQSSKSLYTYIYNFDTNFNIKSLIEIPQFTNHLEVYRWINKDVYGNYELVGERVPDTRTDKVFLFYLKIDSAGNVLKRKDLDNLDNFYIGSGGTYTILRSADRKFAITINKRIVSSNFTRRDPYFIGISPEFDTIYHLTKLSELNGAETGIDFYLTYMTKLNNNLGYAITNSIIHADPAIPDYGILYRVSEHGDSLRTVKYQPLNWDSTRARWMDFFQVACTPYNTLVICGRVSDRTDNRIKGWLLHLDSDGCLIPGCGQYINTKNIKEKKEKAFLSYPNPITGQNLYLMSRINSSQNYRLSISDLEGKIIKSTLFKPQEGMQYVIDIPTSIVDGEYLLNIEGEYGQVEKLVIQR